MPDQLEFAGGTAVITGAGSGIGAGLACEAARLGMSVVVADISRERADEIVAAIIGRGGQAEAAVVDVRDDHAMGVLATDVRARLGPVRLLVNNAGIETVGFSWELTAEQWRLSTDINLIGVVNGLRAFIPAMIKDTGEGRRSAIANLSSIGAFMGVPMNAAYLASKHAVLALTECLFLEMELLGCPIDVSVIVPSLVRSRIFEDAPVADAGAASWAEAYRQDLLSRGPAAMGPDEAAQVVFRQLAERRFWIPTEPAAAMAAAGRRAEFYEGLSSRPAAPGILSRLAELRPEGPGPDRK